MDTNAYNELIKSIEHWNEYRVPILRISQPDKNLNFQGAMRFYFQDSGQKVATKCVNVTSADTTKDVIDILIEKFRPDMRMLSVPEYGLYEIHENGDERKLELDERPLFVQLEWNQDDREGRFLLRRMDEKTRDLAVQNEEPSLKRKLSKKEKKKQEKLKKQQQKEQEKADAKLASRNKNGIAERLYNELPETSFTRSISNPEAVMKRRRAQKLEKRLQEFSLEGGQEAGGTLRIFGETINKDVSYKTLLLSTKDTASSVVKQILEKYGKDDEDPNNYCLVQLIVPHSATSSGGDNHSVHDLNTSSALKESILDDQDCPLLINQNHDKSKGILTLHIRHKPADYRRRAKKKPSRAQVQQNPLHPLVVQQLNQRLQINNNNHNNNNNSEQYSNQNSPHNSSQTSGSISHDTNNPPPPPFETIQSAPTMFHNTNGYPYQPQQQQQHHSMSAATLQPRINNHHMNNIHGVNGGTMPRQNYNQPNHQNLLNHHHMNNMQDVNNGGTMPRQNYSQSNHQNLINQHNANNNNKQFAQNQMVPNNNYPVGQQTQMQPPQQYINPTGANDHILPALIQVKEEVEDIFLSTVITHIKPTDTTFRLAPTYVLYMVSRYRASTLFYPELQAPKRAELFVPFTKKIASMIRQTIEIHMRDPTSLAFWLANSSDLSHFYKQDKHLSHFSIEAQEILYDSVKASFKYFLTCKQRELDMVMPSFFDECDEVDNHHHKDPRMASSMGTNISVNQILGVLNDTMATLRKNRVNAALTIQIFSHLFHHICKWLFDRLIGVYDRQQGSMMNGMVGETQNFEVYCNRVWGERLNRKLAMIGGWAEKQGLEQAADFHLARVTQVTLFLAKRYSPRISVHDLKESCDSCDRLNPVQLRALLRRYQPEHPVLAELINNFLFSMDYSYMASEYPLEEDFELKIPFLIPDDGYSSEMVRYIPNGLLDFVSYLSKIRVGDQELCIFTLQPTSSGFWTVYFKNHQPDTPEIIVIQLRKKNNSMGLSIIAAKGIGQERLGIYIKNVVKNGAAALDGRLQAGDQLLEVDGNSLLDITQEMAAELMQRTGPVVTLRIAKQAAIYHNLSDVINSVPCQPPLVLPPPSTLLFEEPHQQPPPPVQPMNHHMNNHHAINQPPMGPDLKSPKKVSWVDTRPDQSLHTLIPPSPSLVPSPPSMPSPTIAASPPQVPSPLVPIPPLVHSPSMAPSPPQVPSPTMQPSPPMAPSPPLDGSQNVNNQNPASESLTLEDIDEVLSSKTHNKWLEDSAGVIGTQEVYNDPRQRIVKERERPNANVNIEKLSFQEKLKMFNLSAKK